MRIPSAILATSTLCCAALTGCGGAIAGNQPALGLRATQPGTLGAHGATRGTIQHVVIIVQENRSLNNLFMGFPGAQTASTGLLCNGMSVPLHAVPLEANYDVGHGLQDFLAAYNNGVGGCFNRERYIGAPPKPPFFNYAYVPQSETAPYWAMASAYTLADETFQSNIDASFTAHQYLIAGQAQSSVDIPNLQPWGCDAPPGQTIKTITPQRTIGPHQSTCFTYPTLANELDAAGVTWRYYAPTTTPLQLGAIWSAFDASSYVRNGPDWAADVISPETNILSDVAAGTLKNVTWVVPNLAHSDHAESLSSSGPMWVASVVDAIGTSPFWNSTAIFVTWDDWGGWFDPQVPAYVDYDGLGFRVPLIAISPYARVNHVAHTHYEFGSILKFIENNWKLARLAPSDTRAAPFGKDVFNFTQPPTPFSTFAPRGTAARILHEPRSYGAPDDE
ncbi:MAG: alkaline phosphatase family protein [Candidatus Baltobacteraceae bacterium]